MNKELTRLRAERELKELRSLVEELKDKEDWQLRIQAVPRLLQVKKTNEFYTEAIPALIEAIQDNNNLVRQAVIPALGDIGASAKPAIPALTKVLTEGSTSEKKAAVYSLGKIGPDSISAKSEMISLLRENDPELEKAVSWALGMLGPEALEDLRKGTVDENSGVKRGTIQAIGSMGPVAVPAIGELENALKDKDPTVRLEAAKAIGNLRAAPEIENSIPVLKEALDDKDPDVRWTISEALRKIGTDEAMDAWGSYETIDTVEARLKQLKNDDKAVRLSAAEALYSIVDEETELDYKIINKALQDTYPKVSIALCEALAKMHDSAQESLPSLMELVQESTEENVRVAAITAIGKIDTGSTVEELIPLLEDEKKDIRLATGLALELIDTTDARKALKKFKWQ